MRFNAYGDVVEHGRSAASYHDDYNPDRVMRERSEAYRLMAEEWERKHCDLTWHRTELANQQLLEIAIENKLL